MNTLHELRTSLHLTQQQLADEAGVTRHSIIRLEQYCYPHPLPNVVDTIARLSGLSSYALTTTYITEVKARRSALSLILTWPDPAAMPYLRYANKWHPFRAYRKVVCELAGVADSAISFCQLVTVHPSVLSQFEAGRTGFPESLGIALLECGMRPSYLTFLSSLKNRSINNIVGALDD